MQMPGRRPHADLLPQIWDQKVITQNPALSQLQQPQMLPRGSDAVADLMPMSPSSRDNIPMVALLQISAPDQAM